MKSVAILAVLLVLLQAAVAQDLPNLLVNGNFSQSGLAPTETSKVLTSLVGWQVVNQVESGIGEKYNSRWGNRNVIEMDSYQNDILRQNVSLNCGVKVLFSIDYAPRVPEKFETCQLNITWNGVLVKNILPVDYEIRTYAVILTAVGGINTLELAGAGKSDWNGLLIANVKLIKLPEEFPA